jgi:hypothetical protein
METETSVRKESLHKFLYTRCNDAYFFYKCMDCGGSLSVHHTHFPNDPELFNKGLHTDPPFDLNKLCLENCDEVKVARVHLE